MIRRRQSPAIPGDPQDRNGWLRVLAEHLDSMLVRGLSPVTVDGRRKTLTAFAAWCLERGITGPADVTPVVVEAYQRRLHRHVTPAGTPLGIRSQQQHLIAIRVLYSWMTKQHLIESSPAADIELPKTPDRLPRTVLTAEQAEAVLAIPGLDMPLGVRDRVMLEVLYATGVRRRELIGLAVADINLTRRTVFVREGKGARDRIVPLGERATCWVSRYLTDTRPRLLLRGDVNEPALFLTRDGTGIGNTHIGKLVEHYLRRAGIPSGGCHVFRHTVATLMLEGGADVRWVQAMLGHRSLTSTQLYTHVDITTLAAVHAATHPAASNRPRRERVEGLAAVIPLRQRVRGHR